MAKAQRKKAKPHRGLRRRDMRYLAVRAAQVRIDLAVRGEWEEGVQTLPPRTADYDAALLNIGRVVERYAEPYERGKGMVALPWKAEVDKLIPTRRSGNTAQSILDKLCATADEDHGAIVEVIAADAEERPSCPDVRGGCSAGAHLHWRWPKGDKNPRHHPDHLHTVSFDQVLRYIRSRLTP